MSRAPPPQVPANGASKSMASNSRAPPQQLGGGGGGGGGGVVMQGIGGAQLLLKVNKVSDRFALTNCIYVHESVCAALLVPESVARAAALPQRNYCQLKNFVFCLQPSNDVDRSEVALSGIQRQVAYVSLGEAVVVEPWVPRERNVFLSQLRLEVDFLTRARKEETFECAKIVELLQRDFLQHCFTVEQKFVVEAWGHHLIFRVLGVEVVELDRLLGTTAATATTTATPGSAAAGGGGALTEVRSRGILLKQSDVVLSRAANSLLKLQGDASKSRAPVMFRPDWNFESMGIGGLDNEFSDIFRRAFASRVFPASVVQQLGINHVRGILLHGPPGTGKTLMARQIGKMLNGKEPTIVNGPEILNKYVGQSEENIRNLFKDAEREQKQRGEESDLYIIIFDEIDAICRARGTRQDGTGVGDTVVNQLLSKIDGVDALNNILLIGMTNRRDMIDEALLRPGRLEVQMEIGLPDDRGRLQILRIHTSRMREHKLLEPEVDLTALAGRTKNFSGAELEGLVKSASSFALNRQIDPHNLTKPLDPSKIRVTRADFEQALTEVKPAYGASRDEFAGCMPAGVVPFGSAFERLVQTAHLFMRQLQGSNRTPLLSLLLEGRAGCGKTALASHLALSSGFPFVKLVSPDQFIGYGEAQKCARLQKVFEDAYRSPLSVIVVDDIERLLEYAPVGPRFSNAVLQALIVLLRKAPPSGRKLLVLATTNAPQVLQDLDMGDVFAATLSVPLVQPGEELRRVLVESGFPPRDADAVARDSRVAFPIKRLLQVVEMARQAAADAAAAGGGAMPPPPLAVLFNTAMHDYGLDRLAV